MAGISGKLPWTGFVDYKVFGPSSEEEQEIRRITVNNIIGNDLNHLKNEIRELFPILLSKNFNIYWKDQEGDMVKIASNKELETALNENVNKYHNIYIKTTNSKELIKDIIKTEFVHPTVTCDNCQRHPLNGFRYKCLICFDYDLCIDCEKSQMIHTAHPMMRIPDPNVFLNSAMNLVLNINR